MRVINPNFSDPLEAWAIANAQTFADWLAAPEQAAQAEIDFAAIRAAFPGANPPGGQGLSDGVIAEVLQVLGYEVKQ